MKKLLILAMAMAMTLSLTACGGSAPASSAAPAPASSAAPAPASSKPAAPASSAAPAPAPASSAAPAPASSAATPAPASSVPEVKPADEEVVYTIDYATIATWIDGGFIGNDESGAPVVMGLDSTNEMAIIIFGDNSDMTAVSFVGEITYGDTTATISDEANQSSLSFGVSKVDDATLIIDMGEEIGKATIKSASTEDVLKTIKLAIDNYKHVG